MWFFKRYKFSASHILLDIPEERREEHSHDYILEVRVTCTMDPMFDLEALDRRVDRILTNLRGKYLNEVKGLSNPTLENFAAYFHSRLSKYYPFGARHGLVSVTLEINDSSGNYGVSI